MRRSDTGTGFNIFFMLPELSGDNIIMSFKIKSIFSWPIKYHLILLVTVATIPFFVIMAASTIESRNEKTYSITMESRHLVMNIASRQESIVAGVEQLFKTLAKVEDIREKRFDHVSGLLESLLQNNPQYGNILVADIKGNVLASARSFKPGLSIADRKFYLDVMKTGKFSPGEYIIGKTANKPLINFGYPVTGPNGDIFAIIAAGIDLEYIKSILKNSLLPEGSTVGVLDYKGIILYREKDPEKYTGKPGMPENFRTMHDGPAEGSFKSRGVDGIAKTIFYKKLFIEGTPDPYLYIMASTPENYINEKTDRELIMRLSVFGAVFAVAIISALLIAKFAITERINSLLSLIVSIDSGYMAIKAGRIVSGGELGDLAKAFDELGEKLAARETEKEQTLMELMRAGTYNRRLIESNVDPMLVIDSSGIITDVNSSAEKITGCTRNKLIGSNFSAYFTEPEKAVILYNQVAATGEIRDCPFEIKHVSGHVTSVLLNSSVYTSDSGEVFGVIATARDMTEPRQRELEVFHEKERLLVTLRSIGDGVITTDVDGRITLMNTVAEDMTGRKLEDARQKPVTDIFCIESEKDRSCENPVTKALVTGEVVSVSGSSVLVSAIGRKCMVESSAAPILDRGNVIGAVLVFRDITEKQKIENALQNTQKLESLSILAGGIAHDFNNLLGGVFGYLDMALELAEDNNVEAVKTSLNGALGVFERAKNLTMQLLTFAKGGSPVRKTESISKLVRDAVQFALTGSNISSEFIIPDDIWLCYFDKNQISQVIDNIIINARQAMPLGGKLEIRLLNIPKNRAGTLLKPVDYIQISIKDNGPGISRENLAHIFDPFFTTKKHGSGIGLATCHSIISKHDGMIDVESEEGHGTIFNIYLPASIDRSETVAHTKAGANHRGDGKILVMDDEVALIKVVSAMLNRLGYSTSPASNGEEAIELVKKSVMENSSFSVAILDLTIPGGMGGKDIVKEISRIDPFIKTVASSGYSEDSVMADPFAYGFAASINKPFRINELAKVLESLPITVRQ